jgi:hypothetical protein
LGSRGLDLGESGARCKGSSAPLSLRHQWRDRRKMLVWGSPWVDEDSGDVGSYGFCHCALELRPSMGIKDCSSSKSLETAAMAGECQFVV